MRDDDLIKPQLANRSMQSGGDIQRIYYGQLLNLHCAPKLREPEEQQQEEDLEKLELQRKLQHITFLNQKANKE